MNATGQFLCKEFVYRTMPGEQGLSGKGVADQRNMKMRILRTHGVAVTFIHDFKVLGEKRGAQFVV